MSDAVKVKWATGILTGDGYAVKFKTTEGVDIEFVIDDVAAMTLALTMTGAMKSAASRKPVIFKDEETIS